MYYLCDIRERGQKDALLSLCFCIKMGRLGWLKWKNRRLNCFSYPYFRNFCWPDRCGYFFPSWFFHGRASVEFVIFRKKIKIFRLLRCLWIAAQMLVGQGKSALRICVYYCYRVVLPGAGICGVSEGRYRTGVSLQLSLIHIWRCRRS